MAVGRLESDRLTLEPLQVEHADELAPVLADEALHEFIGGRPPTREDLRRRFARQVKARSPDGHERWVNWLVRLRATGRAAGTMQATIRPAGPDEAGDTADLAWVIGVPYQGRGLAKEAAGLVAAWLREQGIERLGARIHPRHAASMAVARSIGLVPTPAIVAGEVQWHVPSATEKEPHGARADHPRPDRPSAHHNPEPPRPAERVDADHVQRADGGVRPSRRR